jgi:hypothetical protein
MMLVAKIVACCTRSAPDTTKASRALKVWQSNFGVAELDRRKSFVDGFPYDR